MHRSSDVIKHKVKIAIELQKTDGTAMEGHVFLGGTERVLDLMNHKDLFLPVSMNGSKVLLINKYSISQIRPYDGEWMDDTYTPPPIEPPRSRH